MSTTTQSPDSATQLYIQLAEAKEDTIVLKDGSIKGILKCDPVNLSLKNEEERKSIIYGYQGFLNTLEYPIQILVRSRKLDVDDYIGNLKKITKNQNNPLLKEQSQDYIEFISKLVDVADIMEKEFFIVVTHKKNSGVLSENFLTRFWNRINPADSQAQYKARLQAFDDLKKNLESKLSTVATALSNMSIKSRRLKTEEIIALFYKTYNPSTSQEEKIENMDLSQLMPLEI